MTIPHPDPPGNSGLLAGYCALTGQDLTTARQGTAHRRRQETRRARAAVGPRRSDPSPAPEAHALAELTALRTEVRQLSEDLAAVRAELAARQTATVISPSPSTNGRAMPAVRPALVWRSFFFWSLYSC